MAEKKENETKKGKKGMSRGVAVVADAVTGRWLSTKFFGRHWGIILAFVILIMIYITNRYQCTVAMETIQKMEKELQVAKSERIREKSYYMSAIREKSMQQRINDLGLNLEVSQRPPFLLQKD